MRNFDETDKKILHMYAAAPDVFQSLKDSEDKDIMKELRLFYESILVPYYEKENTSLNIEEIFYDKEKMKMLAGLFIDQEVPDLLEKIRAMNVEKIIKRTNEINDYYEGVSEKRPESLKVNLMLEIDTLLDPLRYGEVMYDLSGKNPFMEKCIMPILWDLHGSGYIWDLPYTSYEMDNTILIRKILFHFILKYEMITDNLDSMSEKEVIDILLEVFH